ncbi:precorrin-6y C5,15-methyltransferase (decarboxylating) subunit CbiE [Clostridium algidicarnis]|uniref:precorrin-6y C5,15-methyltransferase (decarboxylating) subunit CbiE n=1 Tax=Clostridium algidicarnis TaxID=37659 RepID=UPI003FD6E83C
MVYVVGIGPGHKDYILPKAIKVLNESDIIIGFSRALDGIDVSKDKKIGIKSLSEVLDVLEKYYGKNISIIASGDPSFYGISDFINRNYKGETNIITGISSIQYFASKINKALDHAYLGSVHGREEDFIHKVKENNRSFWLTDRNNTPSILCKKLNDNNIKAKVYVGEDLSYDNEIITIDYNYNLLDKEFSSLCVIMVESF